MDNNMRVIIAGGGTGGHIFPAVAIAHALQRLRPGTQLLFVGATGRMEMEKVPQEGFKIVGLDIAGFNRSNMLKNLTLPFKIWKANMQAKAVLKDFKPNAVVGVGGYASFPVLNAAQSAGIPTLIQEQNSYAGKSNKILGRRAKAICVAYENMDKFFPKDKLILTGNPVREKIAHSTISREEGQSWLGMAPAKRTVLVVGGSLGAKSVNEAIDKSLEEILAEDVQVIWQTGKPYYQTAAERAKAFEGKVKVFEFIREMDYAYAAADMVISRAGALAIAELCIIGKPVIFVPFPYAAEDHQTSNAMALVEHNAAMMVKDSDAATELVKKLKTLLHDTAMQDIMMASLKNLAIKDADERIAEKVIEIANK
ncbi:MAG: undecaprenyldiphospho-muramoylpentapeptide beta-N-acetylglucosaminyltransferase [Bacteroidetes bacterium]|nr:undecaprenyldiphospho-muramoylpentapeptide beta-N-acetylglucosaminyltransferase [Bacteroidota bacterium]